MNPPDSPMAMQLPTQARRIRPTRMRMHADDPRIDSFRVEPEMPANLPECLLVAQEGARIDVAGSNSAVERHLPYPARTHCGGRGTDLQRLSLGVRDLDRDRPVAEELPIVGQERLAQELADEPALKSGARVPRAEFHAGAIAGG